MKNCTGTYRVWGLARATVAKRSQLHGVKMAKDSRSCMLDSLPNLNYTRMWLGGREMMSEKSLERVSPRYREGYRDGYEGNPKKESKPGCGFTSHDYEYGFKAGKNDKNWESGETRHYKAA